MGSISEGNSIKLYAVLAISSIPILLSVPFTLKIPLKNSISVCEVSNINAAMVFPRSIMRSLAIRRAAPPLPAEREPKVPRPWLMTSVSPWKRVIFSIGTPSISLTICLKVVSCPCPCASVPISTLQWPEGSKRISAVSSIAAADCSIANAIPRPRNLPRVFASLRRFSKLA